MRFQRLVAEFTAAVACLVFAAGCTSSPSEPEPLPEPTRSSVASQSPSPSATATPPTLPAEAEGTSPAAAKAFARHYFDAVDYAALSGDTGQLRDLGAGGCQTCASIAGGIEGIYGDGGHITSEDWQLRNIRVLKATDSEAVLALDAFLGPEVIVQSDGTRTENQGGKQPMTMYLKLSGPRPVVTRLDLVT